VGKVKSQEAGEREYTKNQQRYHSLGEEEEDQGPWVRKLILR
jgi:hypothetical protein